MADHPLDTPQVLANVFFPRGDSPGNSQIPGTIDGTIAAADGVPLGYRLYQAKPTSALIVYFHGNGEIASDYDFIAPMYLRLGLALLIIDFRGYGWSEGTPRLSTLLPDAEAVFTGLDQLLPPSLRDMPIILMGRSLGSAPAIYLAQAHGDKACGLIVESGYADTPSVFRRLGIPVQFNDDEKLPLGNAQRLASVQLPLLVIHGEADALLPVEHADRLFAAALSADKRLLKVPRAGHNDLLSIAPDHYFAAIRDFVTQCLENCGQA